MSAVREPKDLRRDPGPAFGAGAFLSPRGRA